MPRALRFLLLLLLLLLLCAPAPEACPRLCACDGPADVHCTFRSLAAFPAGIPRGARKVNLGFNRLPAVPAAPFAGMTSLEVLMLHGNEIENIEDGAFGDLGALQVLKLSYNRLSSLTPRSLQGLTGLIRLHLDHNRLTSLGAGTLRGLTSLRVLSLADNALAALPPLPPPLETLYLHGNPWACDRDRTRWLTARVRGALRCGKGGAACAECASPAGSRGRDLRDVTEATTPEPTGSEVTGPGTAGADDVIGDVTDASSSFTVVVSATRDVTGAGGADLEPVTASAMAANVVTDAPGPTRDAQTPPPGPATSLPVPVTRPQFAGGHLYLAFHPTLSPTTRGGETESRTPLQMPRETPAGERPRIVTATRGTVTVAAGGDAVMHCVAVGRPEPRVTWRKEETGALTSALSHPRRLLVFPNGTLAIRASHTQDSGRYTCEAANAHGVDRAHVTLRVSPEPTRIRSEPVPSPSREDATLTVQPGTRVRLPCSRSVGWILPDGARVASSHSATRGNVFVSPDGTLHVLAAGPGDAGRYACVTSDPPRRAVTLTVSEDPARARVRVATVAVDVGYGDTAELPCAASGGVGTRDVAWSSPARKAVAPSGRFRVRGVDGSLVISGARRSDGGVYTCVTRAPGGGVVRSTALLRIVVRAPRIVGVTRDVSAAPGSRVLVPCRAEGTPAPRVMWAPPWGVVLPAPYGSPSSRVSVRADGTLEIRGARASDAGVFECVARSKGGEDRVRVRVAVATRDDQPVTALRQ